MQQVIGDSLGTRGYRRGGQRYLPGAWAWMWRVTWGVSPFYDGDVNKCGQ
jgi:hypothetical protein